MAARAAMVQQEPAGNVTNGFNGGNGGNGNARAQEPSSLSVDLPERTLRVERYKIRMHSEQLRYMDLPEAPEAPEVAAEMAEVA